MLGVREIDLPVDAAGRLDTLRAETGLKLPDCCVLLSAETASAFVVSVEERLTRAATARGLGSPD